MNPRSVNLSIAVQALETALFADGILAQMEALSFQFTSSHLSAMADWNFLMKMNTMKAGRRCYGKLPSSGLMQDGRILIPPRTKCKTWWTIELYQELATMGVATSQHMFEKLLLDAMIAARRVNIFLYESERDE